MEYLNTLVINYFLQTVIGIGIKYFYDHVTVIVLKYIFVAICNSLRNTLGLNFSQKFTSTTVYTG